MSKTILIVDDEKNIANILEFNLRKEGFNTIIANDGESAVDIAYDKNLSAEGATKLWCNSPCHYEVMTIGDLKEVGLASWHDNNGNVYWVQLFTG